MSEKEVQDALAFQHKLIIYYHIVKALTAQIRECNEIGDQLALLKMEPTFINKDDLLKLGVMLLTLAEAIQKVQNMVTIMA